jgi:hypothetical protein
MMVQGDCGKEKLRGTMEKTAQVDQEEHRHLDNPADRPLVTLDTNIVIALRNNED